MLLAPDSTKSVVISPFVHPNLLSARSLPRSILSQLILESIDIGKISLLSEDLTTPFITQSTFPH
jgi:hypothetical protein